MDQLKRIIYLPLLLFVLLPVRGQLIRVQSEVERDSILIGEQMDYILHVDAAAGVEFQLPELRDTLSKDLEILARLSSDSLQDADRQVVKHHYRITSFEPGMQLIPSMEVIYRQGSVLDTARSMPLFIYVEAPEVDTSQQIKAIKAPINTPLSFREVLPWMAVGLGILGLAFLLWFLLRKYLKPAEGPGKQEAREQEPAHLIAFRELDRIKEEKIWEKGRVKEYYTRLTEVTRQYMDRQYQIPAMELTTEQILQAFQRAYPEQSMLDEILRDLLELADLVKFAKEQPLPAENQSHLNNAYIFVQKTYPQFYREEVRNE